MLEKRQIVLKNGEVIHYLEQGSGEQTILLIHGNFSSSVYYEPFFERAPKGYRLIAPDLRGYGDSSYYKRINSLADFAHDLNLFLEEKEIKEVYVIGWSLGGGVAMEFAVHYPKKTKKLILINSTTHRGYPVFKKDANGQMLVGQAYENAEAMAKDPVQVLPLLVAQQQKNFDLLKQIFELTIYTVNKPTEEQTKHWIEESLKQRNLADADFALASFNMSNTHNFYNAGTNTIGQITVPVLHVWGDKDVTVPEYMIQDNVKALESVSTLIVYPNCGHSPFVDVPDQLTSDIIRFINQ